MLLSRSSVSCLILFTACVGSLRAEEGAAFHPRLFAFQNGVSFGSFDDEAQALKKLGYDGIGSISTRNLDKRIAAYEAVGLRVFSIYVSLGDPSIPKAIGQLKGRKATVELTVRKKIDTGTVTAIQELADLAAKADVRIALYPHAGFAIAKIDPALELIEKVDRQNVGVMFNLCHFLMNEKHQDLEATIERAGSKIFAASTCGADRAGRSWSVLIRPLDQGNFKQARLFAALKKINFRGAVGLQCYAVRGDKKSNLQRSIKAWQQILAEANE